MKWQPDHKTIVLTYTDWIHSFSLQISLLSCVFTMQIDDLVKHKTVDENKITFFYTVCL